MEALSNAGLRIDKTAAISEEYDVAFNKYMDDPTNVDLKNRVEELEATYAATRDYQTLIEKGDQQVAYLKALDFVDALGPRLRLYNVCRARTNYNMEKGCHCSCGMAFPAKMWKRPNKTAWKWICQVDWEPLVIEKEKYPEDEMLEKWVNDLVNQYGDDWKKWPQPGCNSNFRPWRNGASMVVELKMGPNEWTSFMAERLPEELDDEIKKVHANYFLAQKDLTADELLDVLPIQFPMAHNFQGFPGIARYPVDAWEEAGAPMFTVKSWAKLAMKVAVKDMTNLAGVFELAKKLETLPNPLG